MRPPKPRITKPNLTWKWNRRRACWDPYHRVSWTEGGKRRQRAILLKWKGDPQTLDDEYWKCQSGRHEAQERPAKYTWKRCVELWRADPRVQSKLSAGTRASYLREMEAVLEKNATKDMRNTTRQGVRRLHDKLAAYPRKADWRVQMIRLLWNYAKNKQDWPLGDNPASGIDLFGKQRELEPWPDWMVAKLSDAPHEVEVAAETILNTGQRPSAAVEMRFDAFNGEWMTVLDEKSDELIEVFCPERMQKLIQRIPKRGAHLLPKNLTEPLGYDAIEKRFRAWRKDLGARARKYSLHGLRKLAVVQLAEAGCSDAEIQAVTNQSPETVAYYRARASRKRLSKAAQRRRDQNENGT